MPIRDFNRYRHIFRDFNITLGIFRTPVYPGMTLSYAELTLLLFLYEKPTIRLEDLSLYFRVNRSSISRKLQTLEKEGLITRKVMTGKAHKLRYRLTAEAMSQMERTVARSQKFLELLYTYMGDKKFKAFFALMKSATEAIDHIRRNRSDIY